VWRALEKNAQSDRLLSLFWIWQIEPKGVPLTTTQKAMDLKADQPAKREARLPTLLSAASLVGATIQGVCAILVASSSLKVLLGVVGIAAAVKTSSFHSDKFRVPLLLVSAALASLTLYVLWNGWRLRRRPAASWRIRPLSRAQKLGIWFSLLASVLSWLLIIVEIIEHPIAF
jgi:hypothetical protein